eukprot:6697944-Prymnesium_polylepis.1
MRTTKFGLRSDFLVRGIFSGSKSGGKYLLITFRSPMLSRCEGGGGGGDERRARPRHARPSKSSDTRRRDPS